MRRRLILISGILAVIVLALLATYFLRRNILEHRMAEAMESNDGPMIRRLVESWPPPIKVRDKHHRTPLHWAADHNDVGLAAMLLDRNAAVDAFAGRWHDPDPENPTDLDFSEETTPLHRALFLRNWDIARLLVLRGADINLETKGCGDGCTSYAPLEVACFENADADFIRFLIRSGARVAHCGNQFHWPLALAFNRPEVMKVLLDHGADIEQWGVDGFRTLHEAVFEDKPVAVEFLLAHGAKVDALDLMDGDCTALHLAARYGKVECAKALISHGADTSAKDKDGKTPLMLASEQHEGYLDIPSERRDAMIALLSEHK